MPTAHTPGPWLVGDAEPDPVHDVARVREMGYRHGIAIRTATPLPNPFPLSQGIANAALIAAAPDMLAVLRKVAAYFEPIMEDNEAIKLELEVDAVIARAEGRE